MSRPGCDNTRRCACGESKNDVTHYGKTLVALKETIRLMGEVDEVIPSWPVR